MTEYSKMEKKRPNPGEWVRLPRRRKIGCCDCGLVHDFEFKVISGRLMMRAWRDEPTTEAHRAATWLPCVPRFPVKNNRQDSLTDVVEPPM